MSREDINATLNSIEGSVGANELSAYQVFTRMKRLVQAAQAQAGDEVTVKGFANGGSCAVVQGIAVYGLDVGDKLYTRPQPAVNQQLLEALQNIANPVSYLRREAEKDGCVLNGHAIHTSNDPEFLKGIARAAIAAAQEQGK